MKLKILFIATMMPLLAVSVNAQSLGDVLGGLGKASGKDKIGDVLTTIGKTVDNATATTSFDIDDLHGTWTYVEPAVSFSSDDALKKIGGAAAATELESKLAPYYDKVGMSSVTLVVDEENNFQLKMKSISIKGTITREEGSDMLVFNFNALRSVSLGKINCIATMSGKSKVSLAFDAKRFVDLITKIAAISQRSSLQSVADLLASYDGVYIGFRMKKN